MLGYRSLYITWQHHGEGYIELLWEIIHGGYWVGVGQIDGLNGWSYCLLNNQIADKLSGPSSETWGLGGVLYVQR